VVRYSPTAVSIRDATAIQPIYSSSKEAGVFTINDSYKPLLGIDPKTKQDVRSLVTMEEDAHAKLRRAVSGAFSPNSVAEMEHVLDEAITELLSTLDGAASISGGVIDLSEILLFYSLDNATSMIFGEPGGHLHSNSDVQGLGSLIRERFAHWGYWSSLPWLERVVTRNPISLYLQSTQQPADFVRQAGAKVAERLARPEELNEQKDLLCGLIKAREKYPEVLHAKGLMGIVMSTISGAADTTASSLVGIFYFLSTHPRVLKNLRKELEGNGETKSPTPSVPRFAEMKKLRYLDAVVKESMRLFSLLNWPMERRVPQGGATFCGHYLSAGVSAGILPAVMHMDPSVYGEDITVFRPERWLTGDAELVRKMEASFLGFSRGKRVCLGQNIAIMQLKKVVPALVGRYEFGLVDEARGLEADYSSAIVIMKPLMMRVRRRDG
jgi:cytochrome P450